MKKNPSLQGWKSGHVGKDVVSHHWIARILMDCQARTNPQMLGQAGNTFPKCRWAKAVMVMSGTLVRPTGKLSIEMPLKLDGKPSICVSLKLSGGVCHWMNPTYEASNSEIENRSKWKTPDPEREALFLSLSLSLSRSLY